MAKTKIVNFNDGFIQVYEENVKKTNFGARTNPTGLDNLKFIVKLAYTEMTKRLQDLEFAEANSRSLSLKVKTRLYTISNDYKVVLNNTLYDIITVDIDRPNRVMYLYLEEVRKIEVKADEQY